MLSHDYPFLENQELKAFVNQWIIHKKLNRFDFLTSQGDIERNIYFIIKGTFHVFYPFKTPVTRSLAGPHDFHTCFASFLTQQPAKAYLQALSKAEVVGISKEALERCIHQNRKIAKMYRLSMESLLLGYMQKEILLLLPASERVESYLNSHPNIFQQIPHKYIASYLNIAPETLSRILNVSKS